jgi:hypothetical protein
MRLLTEAQTAFEAHTYPMTTDELIDAHGDMVLELPNGTETLADALGRSGPETFETAEDAMLTACSGMSSKAIGRVGYSDRDPVAMGEDGPEQVSF